MCCRSCKIAINVLYVLLNIKYRCFGIWFAVGNIKNLILGALTHCQVNNRDMSIAVLRAFIAKRKLEHEAVLSKRTKTAAKVSDKPVIKPEIPEESISEDGKSNGQCKASEETSEHEPCSISEKMVDNLEEKSRGELKPPRVLEVFENCCVSVYIASCRLSRGALHEFFFGKAYLKRFSALTGFVSFWFESSKICTGSRRNWSGCGLGQR